MRLGRVYLLVLAALCFAVALPSGASARSLHGKPKEISKEKREEDEREQVTDMEIVERELAAELPAEETFFAGERAALEGIGKPGEEKAPDEEVVNFRQSVVSGGTHVKVRVNPHGSATRVWMYLDWAKKCNTLSFCPTKGKYTHEGSRLGSASTRAIDLKGKFSVGECQVGKYVLVSVNRWGVTRETGWFGLCY
jgi:hypothetical protein